MKSFQKLPDTAGQIPQRHNYSCDLSAFQNIQKQAAGILLTWQHLNVKWDFAGGRNMWFPLLSALSDLFNITQA